MVSRPHFRRFLLLVSLVLMGQVLTAGKPPEAANRATVDVWVSDTLARSNRSVRIESRVVETGILGAQGVGGERVALWVDHVQVATGLTGGDGRAYFEYQPRRIGLFPMKVVVAESPRVGEAVGTGTLAVWERRRSILLVESRVLLDPESPGPASGLSGFGFSTDMTAMTPNPNAAEELGRLSQFYYNLIYLVPIDGDGGARLGALRTWLTTHRFPPGVVLPVSHTTAGLEELIIRLKAAGWDNLKAGVGRTPMFAQALVAQRLTVAVVADESRETYPRRARRAKDWKTARKYLQD